MLKMADASAALSSVSMNISNQIILEMEDYLSKVFGYPKAFLVVVAKASFGRIPSPILSYESFIQKTWKFLNNIENLLTNLTPAACEVTIHTGHSESFCHVGTQTDEDEQTKNQVQITAGTDEIKRRIQSFIQRKRQEVDAYNRREFCVFREEKEAITCARTDAAYVPRHGKKSLLKTYRVYNKVDPLLSDISFEDISSKSWRDRRSFAWEPTHPSTKLSLKHLPPHTYERIDNIEQHLKVVKKQWPEKETNDITPDVLQKLKDLEMRLLYLEGLSPEYMRIDLQNQVGNNRYQPYRTGIKQSLEKDVQEMASVDKRITELKQTLFSKANLNTQA